MLSNKLALVTGAASGIGLSIAHKFAKNGANLILVDVSNQIDTLAKEIQSQTTNTVKVSTHICDISDAKQVNNLFLEIKKQYENEKCKLPNVIVNSAGITRDSFLLKMSEKDFDQVISVNLKGTFLVTQAAARALVETIDLKSNQSESNGSIINLSSVVAKYGNLGQANYSASKAGVEGFSRSVAKELAKYKIRCNIILPGFIKTPMTDKVPSKYLEQMVRMVPMGRVGLPNDIADLALFLASDSSSYITGSSIECSGGLSF